MNDDELITALREQRGTVLMTTPVEQIISRGRVLRARRRLPGAAVAVGTAAAAAAVVAVTVALPSSRPAPRPAASRQAASHPASGPGVQLAAWAVTRQPGGSIQVSFFRQLRDPAALQATLRADGVPVSVIFTGQQNPACHPYSASGSMAFWPYGPKAGPVGMYTFIRHPKDAYSTQAALVIHPSALPSGAGLEISVMRGIPRGPSGPWPYSKGSGHPVVEVGLVKASPQCTGS